MHIGELQMKLILNIIEESDAMLVLATIGCKTGDFFVFDLALFRPCAKLWSSLCVAQM